TARPPSGQFHQREAANQRPENGALSPAPMLANEDAFTSIDLGSAPVRLSVRAGCRNMDCLRTRDIPDAPAMVVHSEAPVHLFGVHEIVLVQGPDIRDSLSANH